MAEGSEAWKGIEDLAKNVRAVASFDHMKALAESFRPGPLDVICARGNQAYNHAGNKRFRAIVESYLEEYSKATSKVEKSVVVSTIIDLVREGSPNGGFVKEENGRWYEVGDQIAREKVGQGFRNLLHFKYKSSTKAKKIRREQSPSQAKNLESSDNSEEGYARSLVAVGRDANTDATPTVQALFRDQYVNFLESIVSSNSGGETGGLSWSNNVPASSEIPIATNESQSYLAPFSVQSIMQDAQTSHSSDSSRRNSEGLHYQPDQQVIKSFSLEPVASSDFFTEGDDGDFDISSVFSHQKDSNEDMERPN